MVKRSLLFLFLAIGMVSCQNDVSNDIISPENNIEKTTYSFMYKGELYTSDVIYLNDSTSTFENESVLQMFETFKNNPSMISYIHEDGTIEYFDNEEDFILKQTDKIELRMSRDQSLFKVVPTQIKVKIYQNSGYGGRDRSYYHVVATDKYNTILIPRLADNNMGDRTSSIKMDCEPRNNPGVTTGSSHLVSYSVEFYQSPNYGGYKLVFGLGSRGGGLTFIDKWHVSELKSFYRPDGKNWNDSFSSMKIVPRVETYDHRAPN